MGSAVFTTKDAKNTKLLDIENNRTSAQHKDPRYAPERIIRACEALT